MAKIVKTFAKITVVYDDKTELEYFGEVTNLTIEHNKNIQPIYELGNLPITNSVSGSVARTFNIQGIILGSGSYQPANKKEPEVIRYNRFDLDL